MVFAKQTRQEKISDKIVEEVAPSQPYNGLSWEVREKEERERLSQVDASDPHVKILSEFRDVKICGQDYRTKTVLIDGTDILKRISDILATKNASSYCEEFLQENPIAEELIFHIIHPVWGGYNQEQKENTPLEAKKEWYLLHFGKATTIEDFTHFSIDIKNKKILISGGFGDAAQEFPLTNTK